jgi:hypothetical protein
VVFAEGRSKRAEDDGLVVGLAMPGYIEIWPCIDLLLKTI